jgi:dipeptidyl aminopeptidase/acylaminoacyl peptidase
MLYALIVLLIVALAVVYSVSIHAFKSMTLGRRRTMEESFESLEKDRLYTRDEYEKLPKEEVEVESKDGLALKGTFIEKFKGSKRVIIIVHGYKASYIWSLQFVNMFFSKGFNVLLVDQRSHGRSEGTYATYGHYEKYDLDLWVDWVR